MSHQKRLIGEFIGRRAKNPDTDRDPWDPKRDKSPLEVYPDPDFKPSIPATVPVMGAPALAKPSQVVHTAAPTLSVPAQVPFMPVPANGPRHDPPIVEAPPSLIRGDVPIVSAPENGPRGQVPLVSAPALLPNGPGPTQVEFAPVVLQPLPPPIPVATVEPKQIEHTAAPPIQERADIPMPPAPGGIPDGPRFVAGQLDESLDIQSRMASQDATLSKIVKDLDRKGVYVDFATGPGTQAFNPFLYAKSVARLGSHLGKTGIALFAASQFGLFLLNRHGKIWNPITAIPPPIIQNFVPAALDVLTGTPRVLTGYDDSIGGGSGFYSKNHGPGADDIHLSISEGKYNEVRIVHYPPFVELIAQGGRSTLQKGLGTHLGAMSQLGSLVDDPLFGSDGSAGQPLVQAAINIRNKYQPDEGRYSESAVVTVDDLIEDSLSYKNAPGKTGHLVADKETDLLRYSYGSTRGSTPKDGLISRVAGAAKTFLGSPGQSNKGEFRPDLEEKLVLGRPIAERKLSAAAFPGGIIPAKFKGENEHGFIVTPAGRSPTEIISDDAAYVPVSITDLRPISNSYRTIYFRPLNLKINESFSPTWNKSNFFGRTDPVATYESTGRSFSISFDLAAFGPEDLLVIYKKKHWLESMVYPEYDKNLLYAAGPVVRARVGDIMNAVGPEGTRGLPGIIESLDFDYNEGPWELADGLRLPRFVRISMTFTVLHDRPIGRGAEGKFGGIGNIRDGVYYPPGLEPSKGAGSTEPSKLPDVTGEGDSFRSIKGVKVNDYEKFRDIREAPVRLK